jgi:hypothetical protein
MVFHYSGVLLQWLERRHSEFLLLLKDLAGRRQAELLGGGFYEPLLPLLPLPDKIGQIEMFTTYLRRQFGKRPAGCWLPALSWEQSLTGPLNTCGMAYSFLNERAFAAAGGACFGETCFAPCITEDQGKIITMFPISHRIGEALTRESFASVLESVAARLPADREHTVTVFPDRIRGEGEGSPELFYHRLFEELSGAESRFEFALPGRVFRGLKDPGKLYFPSSAGWGADYCHLPRRCLTEYPEAKGIYAKMMFTHLLINQLRGDKARKRTAREELWKAQGGDLFQGGGKAPLYRHPLRKAVYRALLEAEKISRGKGNFSPSLSSFDFEFDGQGDYLFQGDPLNCYIRPGGASVFELDYLPRSWNYLDTLSGRGYRRTAFADWLLPPSFSPREEWADNFPGARFCGEERFEPAEMDRVKGTIRFRLPPRPELPLGAAEIEKTYHLKKDALTAEYLLRNRGDRIEEFVLAPRIDLSFPGEGEAFLRLARRPSGPPEPGEGAFFEGAEALEFQDLKNEVLITFSANRVFPGRVFPVYGGDPVGYQSHCLLPLFPLRLEPGESWTAEFRLRFSSLRRARHDR